MIKMAITKQQLLDALDVIKEVTDGDVTYSIRGKLENQITIEYYNGYEEDCEATIIVGINNIIENPKVAVLKQNIADAEEKLTNLKKELAKFTQR